MMTWERSAADVLMLVPGGYPVTIDVAQATIAGAGTAMHFVLPVHGHNLPLLHRHERKLLVALHGQVEIRSGARTLAVLQTGQALCLPAGVPHRAHQHGEWPSTVGVALWPGQVEAAFRALATAVATTGYSRANMIALFARYGVEWSAAASAAVLESEIRPLRDCLAELPSALSRALQVRWGSA